MTQRLTIEYYAKDYAAIKSAIIEKIKADESLKNVWTDFSENDLGIIITEVISGIADMLSFNMDNQVRECYLDTAYRRENVARLARELGYEMKPKQAGITKVSTVINTVIASSVTIPKYHPFHTVGTNSVTYLSNEAYLIPANQSCIFEVFNQPTVGGQIDTSDNTKIKMVGVNTTLNTDNAKLYAMVINDGSDNKMSLFTKYPTNATNDNNTVTSVRNVVQPTNVTGVVLSIPTGIDGNYDLVFTYNGGSGMTLTWNNGVSIVVDAGGNFVLTDSTGNNTITAAVTVVSLPGSSQADYNLTVSTTDTSDNAYKVAFGNDNAIALTIDLSEVNSSNLAGTIDITNDLNVVEYKDLELWVDGPVCFEGTIITDTLASNGTANQTFQTTNAIQQISSSATKTIELTVNGTAWEETTDFFYLEEDKFKARTIDLNFSEIIFGDGDSGNIPDPGVIIVKYVDGNGADGAVGSNKIILADSFISGIDNINLQVNNIEASTEAEDAEEIEITKLNAKSTYQSRGRAVTKDDYEYLISQYEETDKYNPKLVQAYKDETEADLINELIIFVLSIDSDTGRYRAVDVDLTDGGDLYEYVDSIKTIPQGIITTTGNNGLNHGTIVDVTLYWNLTLYEGYETEAETIRENVAEFIKSYFHDLDFQQTVKISELYSITLAVEGIKSAGIYTDPITQDNTTAAYDYTLSGAVNKGKVYALLTTFYNNIKGYIKFTTEASYV